MNWKDIDAYAQNPRIQREAKARKQDRMPVERKAKAGLILAIAAAPFALSYWMMAYDFPPGPVPYLLLHFASIVAFPVLSIAAMVQSIRGMRNIKKAQEKLVGMLCAVIAICLGCSLWVPWIIGIRQPLGWN